MCEIAGQAPPTPTSNAEARSRHAGAVAWAGALALICATAVGCASVPGAPHPAPAPIGPVTLSGWTLTLPVVGGNRHAATVDPAVPTPPWLVPGGDGV